MLYKRLLFALIALMTQQAHSSKVHCIGYVKTVGVDSNGFVVVNMGRMVNGDNYQLSHIKLCSLQREVKTKGGTTVSPSICNNYLGMLQTQKATGKYISFFFDEEVAKELTLHPRSPACSHPTEWDLVIPYYVEAK